MAVSARTLYSRGVDANGRILHEIEISAALWRARTCTSVTSLRLQFRIQPAYGLTIHKAQGLTLDQVVIDLDFGTFKPAGAAYVALSRARSLEGVHLLRFDRSSIKASKEVEAFYKSISHSGKCGYDGELDPKTLRPVNPCDASTTRPDPQTHEALAGGNVNHSLPPHQLSTARPLCAALPAAPADSSVSRESDPLLAALPPYSHPNGDDVPSSQRSFALSVSSQLSAEGSRAAPLAPRTARLRPARLFNREVVSCYVNSLVQAPSSLRPLIDAARIAGMLPEMFSRLLSRTSDGLEDIDQLSVHYWRQLGQRFYDATLQRQRQQDVHELFDYIFNCDDPTYAAIQQLFGFSRTWNIGCAICGTQPATFTEPCHSIDLQRLMREKSGGHHHDLNDLFYEHLHAPEDCAQSRRICGQHFVSPHVTYFAGDSAPRLLLLCLLTHDREVFSGSLGAGTLTPHTHLCWHE